MKDQISTSECWQLPQDSICFPPGQEQPPADSSVCPLILHTFLMCVSSLELILSTTEMQLFRVQAAGVPSGHQQYACICFQHPDPTRRDRFSTGSQAPGRVTKSFGLEQDQETQVNALPYKKYKGSLRDLGLQFLIHLKDGTLRCRVPLSTK